ncbi:MAG: peptidase T [Spirochaetaceae bacterium]|nr:peptidase T [Spirochaetaceae bacterium]
MGRYVSFVDRFKKYISIDTKSDDASTAVPSTKGQLELGALLVQELTELGISAVHEPNGYVYAEIPATVQGKKTLGLIAHLDTAPDLDGKCCNPRVFTYTGGDIVLNEKYTMSVKDFPILNTLVGEELIVTDGNTLLGSDDKAGITIIMEVAQYLVEHPEVPHGAIKIAFTPDEEIGRGADHFDVKRFGADFAYTIDGSCIGELEYENFNAATAKVTITGRNVHPGAAKNIMKNALEIAFDLHSCLPVAERPEYTDGYEGFFLLNELSGTVDTAHLNYIIRDHSKEKFEQKKSLLKSAIDFINIKYGSVAELTVKDTYYNMREKIEAHLEIIDLAKTAFEACGIEPIIQPIRGGTDGARLSYMGLPCPNIFTGGFNFHGRYECIPTSSMQKCIKVILHIIQQLSH